MVFLGELALVPLAWVVVWLWPVDAPPGIGFRFQNLEVGVLSALPPVLLAFWTLSPRGRTLSFVRRILEALRNIAGPTFSSLRVWQMALISLAAGIGEEYLFRGVLQPRLGFLLTSALFGLLHPFTATSAAIAGFMGAYLGCVLKLAEGNLLVPALVHALYDLVYLVLLRGVLRQDHP